jgi:hypothetical protein
MQDKKYLRIENNNFGFVIEGIHEIKETDIEIIEEDYKLFFELQGKGKQFRLKELSSGIGLFDYVEEYIPEVIANTTPTTEDRIKALEMALLEVL